MEANSCEEDGVATGSRGHAELFAAVFGESESDDDDRCNATPILEVGSGASRWNKVKEVPGLWHCSQFLSAEQQQSLLKAISAEEWFADRLLNQAMRFGDLPGWAMDLCTLIRSRIYSYKTVQEMMDADFCQPSILEQADYLDDTSCPLPVHLLEREPLFDQMIVNSYQPGEGISAHVDLMRFQDGIAIISLESSCVMTFTSLKDTSGGIEGVNEREPMAQSQLATSVLSVVDVNCKPHLLCNENSPASIMDNAPRVEDQIRISHVSQWDARSRLVNKVDVLLKPGDLILTHGPARYEWTHEINRGKGHQVWQGQPLVQERRLSVTLRRLCAEEDG